MAEENKPVETTTQAPAQSEKPPEKKETKVEGLDGIAKDPKALRELYKNTPQMFKEVIEEIEAEKKGKEGKPAQQPPAKGKESAAPPAKVAKYGDAEIKLPEDVPVDEKLLPGYFAHWAEQGWSPEQVQKEVDFTAKLAREEKAKQQPQETPEQRRAREDKANVETLTKKWGKDYDKNVEIARRAVLKHGTKATIERLTNSDPVTVEQFYELGKLDVEDHTPNGGTPRNGEEGNEEEGNPRTKGLQKRYSNSPTMKFE